MTTIEINTQQELDNLSEINTDDIVIIEKYLRLKSCLDVFGKLIIKGDLNTEWGRHVVARGAIPRLMWKPGAILC